jgi:hypothetical protein
LSQQAVITEHLLCVKRFPIFHQFACETVLLMWATYLLNFQMGKGAERLSGLPEM